MIPRQLKPVAHISLNAFMGIFRIHLPQYFNLKTKFRYLLCGIDEPDIEYVARNYICEGQCIIDIGANVGLTARAFGKAVGLNGTVHAIEPEYSNFKYLCANTLYLPQVIPHRLAFSDRDEMRALKLNPVSGTGNSLFGAENGDTQNVKCMSFASFCKQQQIKHVDWIKIDVEGAELDVLEGVSSAIKTFPELRILIELCPTNLERAGATSDQLISKLKDFGYTVEAIIKTGDSFNMHKIDDVSKTIGSKSYINLMCTRK